MRNSRRYTRHRTATLKAVQHVLLGRLDRLPEYHFTGAISI
jgi:hypothetical protein